MNAKTTTTTRTRDGAVSEVTGTIFLVALSVVFATAFSLMIFTLPPPAPTSHASLQAYVLPTSPDTLILEHEGGPAIPLSQLTAQVTVNGTVSRVTVGGASFASGWTVVGSDGTTKASTASFAAGDRAIYTSPSLRASSLSIQVVNGQTTQGAAALALTGSAVQAADSTGPTITSSYTLTTTTIQVNLSERLNVSTLTAADFTIDNIPATAIHGYGNGSAVEITSGSAFGTGATPVVRSATSPTGTKDVAGNLITNSTATSVDGVAPAISAITPGVTSTTTQGISWTTSETSTNTVQYGPTPSLGISAAASSGTSPSVTLGSLTPQTQYYFQVVSVDANGNSATSTQGTFTTSAPVSTTASESTNHLVWQTVTSLFSGTLSTTNFNVTLQTTDNATASVGSQTTLQLTTNSTSGYFTNLQGFPTSTATINASQSWATFRYIDWRESGNTSLSVSGPGIIPATTTVQVTGPGGRTIPYHLSFSGLPGGSVTSGATSSSIKVSLLDPFDRPVGAPWDMTINLTTNSTSGTFLVSGAAVTSVTISGGSTNTLFDYLDSRSNAPSMISAYGNNTMPASAIITITGNSRAGDLAPHLEFTAVPDTITSGTLSTGSFSVTLKDRNNNTFTPTQTVTVWLSTNSSSGAFKDSAGTNFVRSINITTSAAATFSYVDYVSGGASAITATANNTIPATTTVGVSGNSLLGVPNHLEFTGVPDIITSGTVSSTFTVTLKDAMNRTVTLPASQTLTVWLDTNSTYGAFKSGASFVTNLNLTNSATVTFTYIDYRSNGTVSIAAFANDTIPARTTIGVSGNSGLGVASHLEIGNLPASIDPGVNATGITVTLKDPLNQTGTLTSALSVDLSTNSTGYFTDFSTGAPISRVVIQAGSTQAQFNYTDLDPNGGFAVLRASAEGLIPDSAPLTVNARGDVPVAGDSQASLLLFVSAVPETSRSVTGAAVMMTIVNPTPTARSMTGLGFTSVSAAVTNFFNSAPAVSAGSDNEFQTSCVPTRAAANMIAYCGAGSLAGGSFVVPAWGLKQVVWTFTSSATTTDQSDLYLTGNITLTSGSPATITSNPVRVHHHGAAGGEVYGLFANNNSAPAAGFTAATGLGLAGGQAQAFTLRTTVQGALTTKTDIRITIPAGWKDINVSAALPDTTAAVGVKQPTATRPGYIEFLQNAPVAGTYSFTVTPPKLASSALAYLEMETSQDDTHSTTQYIDQWYVFPVRLS